MVTTRSKNANPPGQAQEPGSQEQAPAKAPLQKRQPAEGGEPATAEPAAKRRRRGAGDEEAEEAGVAAEGAGADAAAEEPEEPEAAAEKEEQEPDEEDEEAEEGEQPGQGGKEQVAGEEGGGEGTGAAQAAAAGGEGEPGEEEGGMLEQGRITFLYRPKVGKEEVDSLQDVQRFFMLLQPSRRGSKSRLCVLGKKRLPSVRRHERFFGFVEATSDSSEELLQGLGPQEYKTKTRGTRHLAAARAVGQGTYGLAEHKDHVKLLYRLEVPSTPGEAQLEFTIGEEGAFVLQVKNPEAHTEGDPGLSDRAKYSGDKQQEFGYYRWISPRDTQLLDVPRCEFLLIGAREGMPAGLGEQMESEDAAACSKDAGSDEDCMLEQLKQAVQSERVGIATEPAATGELA